jgi:VWFA-related protein
MCLLSALILYSILLPLGGHDPLRSAPPPTTQSKPGNEDTDVVRINTNLVQVDVVVTRDGKQVTDLKPEDFELFEDGHQQKITNFSYISNVPTSSNAATGPNDKSAPLVPAAIHPRDVRRTVAFVIDDLGMSNESVTQTRRQLRKFVDEQLQPNDLVAIIRTGGDVGALQQFTNDKRLLHSAIEHLKWNYCTRTPINVFEPKRSTFLIPSKADEQGPCGVRRDEIVKISLKSLEFVVSGMGALPGRKAMVIFSDSIPVELQVADPRASTWRSDKHHVR